MFCFWDIQSVNFGYHDIAYVMSKHTAMHVLQSSTNAQCPCNTTSPHKAGLCTVTNMVTNVSNIIALATKTSVAGAKMWLYCQTSSPYRKCDYFTPMFVMWKSLASVLPSKLPTLDVCVDVDLVIVKFILLVCGWVVPVIWLVKAVSVWSVKMVGKEGDVVGKPDQLSHYYLLIVPPRMAVCLVSKQLQILWQTWPNSVPLTLVTCLHLPRKHISRACPSLGGSRMTLLFWLHSCP